MKQTEKIFDINNEYRTLIETFKMDKVYEGYEVSLYKVESNIGNMTYYESKSSRSYSPLTFDKLDGMNEFFIEWNLELSNTDED